MRRLTRIAAVVASALQNGIHPREWDRYQTQMRDLAGELDEEVRRLEQRRGHGELRRGGQDRPDSFRGGGVDGEVGHQARMARTAAAIAATSAPS